jgi:peroxin-6
MRRGDVFGVPVWSDASPSSEEEDEEEEDEDDDDRSRPPTAIVYFKVSAISYEPLVALEDDFRSSTSSKARAGELGCWIDVGTNGTTQMVLEGLERERLAGRRSEMAWHSIREFLTVSRQTLGSLRTAQTPLPFSKVAVARLQDLLKSCVPARSTASSLQLSILIKGARGAGKRSLIQSVADETGFSVIMVSDIGSCSTTD